MHDRSCTNVPPIWPAYYYTVLYCKEIHPFFSSATSGQKRHSVLKRTSGNEPQTGRWWLKQQTLHLLPSIFNRKDIDRNSVCDCSLYCSHPAGKKIANQQYEMVRLANIEKILQHCKMFFQESNEKQKVQLCWNFRINCQRCVLVLIQQCRFLFFLLFIFSWHDETETLPHVRFKSRWSVCNFTRFVTRFSQSRRVRSSRSAEEQRIVGRHRLMGNTR